MPVTVNALWLKNLKPNGKTSDFFDKDLRGLGLRLGRNGRKTFFVRYRIRGQSTRRRFTFEEPYPILSLAEARKKAQAIIVEARKGHDPAHKKKVERQAPTFRELAKQYQIKYAANKRSGNKDIQAIQRDLLPAWAHFKAKEISRRDVIQVLDVIFDRGSPIMANRTKALVSKIFNFGISEDLVSRNPVIQIQNRQKEKPRQRILSTNEIVTLWNALDIFPETAETESGKMNAAQIADFFRLILITAQRPVEVRTIKWDDITANWLTISPKISKNGLAHRVYLSQQAMTILTALKQQADPTIKYVFPARNKAAKSPYLSSYHKAWGRIKASTGITDARPHDLRRTAASNMTRLGILRLTVSKILNHKEGGVTTVYDRHTYDKEKQAALIKWGAHLQSIIEGKPSKIIHIRG